MPYIKRSISNLNTNARAAIILAALFFFATAMLFLKAGAVDAFSQPFYDNPSTTIFINEFHYDNTGTDVGEFIEIAGPAGTDLTGYSIVLYNGNGGAVYDTDALAGTIPDQQGGYGTVVMNYPTNGIQNGAPDGIALVGPGDTLVQFLCYEGFFTAVGGPADGVQCTNVVVFENGAEVVGLSLQLTGSGSTYGDFTWTGPIANTAGSPNTGQTFGGASPTPTPTETPTPTPTATPTPGPVANVVINELDSDTPGTDEAEFVELYDGGAGNTALDGLVVVFYNGSNDLSYVAFDLDGFTTDADGYFLLGNAAVPGVDIVFSNNGLQNGADAVAVYAGDATDFPGSTPVTTANLVDAVVYDTNDADDPGLLVLLNGGEPQVNEASRGASADDSIGRCPNGEGGPRNTSGYLAFSPTPKAANDCPAPPVPRTIAEVQGNGAVSPYDGTGVITSGVVTALKSNGFFMQEPDATVDADPNTSEGIFVFTSSAPAVSVGDAVTVTGTASEFFNLTQISAAASGAVVVNSSGNPIPAAITLDPGILNPAGAVDQLERFEGMRVFAAAVRSVAPSNNFGEIWTVLDGVDRPLREPGIDVTFQVPDDPTSGVPDCCIPIWDKNPERIMIDTDGLAGTTAIDVTSGVPLSNITGPLDFTFGDYKIDPEAAPAVGGPNSSAQPVRDRSAAEFTIGGFNIQNFTNSENQRRKAATAIRTILKSPDILGVIEILDLPSLQALAQQINDDAVGAGDPNPGYTAYLVQAPAGGSQNVGFLVKSSVQVDSVTQERGDETFIHPVTMEAVTLHDRPPLVLRATVNPTLDPRPIIVVVNHPRSFINIEDLGGTGLFVREKRKKQAESIAGLLQELQTGSPGTPVLAVGDYNAYQFNDGYTDPVATIKGMPTSDDEVVVDESPDLVNPDFTNLTDTLPADQQYTFIFEGTPQAIDHVFVNPDANSIVQNYTVARINSDYPHSPEYTDVTRPETSSDHDATLAFLKFPQRATTTSVPTVNVTYNVAGQTVDLTANVTASINTVNEGTVSFTVTNQDGSVTIGTAGPADVSGGSATASFFLPGSVLPQALKITADFSGGPTTLSSSGTGDLNVSYAVCLLYDPSREARGGSTIPIKLQLCDSSGVNLSGPGTAVTATHISPIGEPGTMTPVEDAGKSNPDNLFRYDSKLDGYIFNLQTTGLEPGGYLLYFTAGDDPVEHSVEFYIRQEILIENPFVISRPAFGIPSLIFRSKGDPDVQLR